MLEQVMKQVRNYFIREHHAGSFRVHGNMIEPHDFLLDGQRFYVTGSFLSDGVYTFHADGIKNDDDNAAVNLPDETFEGIVYALAVPPTFIALVGEIEEWVGKFGDVVQNPYQSESFNGYSYSKLTGTNNSGSGAMTWESTFRSQLNQWRKVSIL